MTEQVAEGVERTGDAVTLPSAVYDARSAVQTREGTVRGHERGRHDQDQEDGESDESDDRVAPPVVHGPSTAYVGITPSELDPRAYAEHDQGDRCHQTELPDGTADTSAPSKT